jgi:rubrerythrin
MDQWKSADEILDFAISREQESYDFYMGLASTMDRPGMGRIFESFAKEEQGHKKKLMDIKAGKLLMPAERRVLDLKLSDYLVDAEPSSHMDYQQALLVAMKKEKKAFKMYTHLAEKVEDANLQATFLGLAQEEAKHKLRFEIEYDDFVMTDN